MREHRLLWWLLPLLLGGGVRSFAPLPVEYWLVFLCSMPVCCWIAAVVSFRKNAFLFYPAVIFLSLLQFWPLTGAGIRLFWVWGGLFAAMLVMSVFLRGRIWIILHSIVLWLYGGLLLGTLLLLQGFAVSFGEKRNPWIDRCMAGIPLALVAVIFVRFAVRRLGKKKRTAVFPVIDMHTHPQPGEDTEHHCDRLMREAAAAGIRLVIANDLTDNWTAYPDAAAVHTANARMRAAAAKHAPRLQYLVYLNPQDPGWETELAEHASTAVGIKLWIALKDPETGSLENTRKVLRRAGELHLPVLIHTFSLTDTRPVGSIGGSEFCRLAAEFPETTMIGAHSGGDWRRFRRALLSLPDNKYFDISGGYPARNMVKMLTENGEDRILYGSDAYGRSFASQLDKVRLADVADAVKEKILWKNAVRAFHLEKIMAALPPLPAVPRPVWPLPAADSEHFAFCGKWPFNETSATVAELDAELERAGIREAYAANLDAVFLSDPPPANQTFRLAAKRFPRIRPLWVVNPRCAELPPDGFAGVWLSPYLANMAADAPEIVRILKDCAAKHIAVWLNTSVDDFRFRNPALAARRVAPAELYHLMELVPEAECVVQAWENLAGAVERAPMTWRFECSRLSDHERTPAVFFARYDASHLVFGSEFPFRDMRQTRTSLYADR